MHACRIFLERIDNTLLEVMLWGNLVEIRRVERGVS